MSMVQRLREVWLLPIAFVIHDGEEVLTMPRWIAQHRPELERIAQLGTFARRLIEDLPDTTGSVFFAASLELIGLTIATALVARAPRRTWAMWVYAGLLGIFVAHSLTHVLLSAIVFGGYTPGLISAVLVIPPAGYVVYRRLFTAGLLTPTRAAAAALIAAVAFAPLFVLILEVAGKGK
jgi:hypothetical protein